jgi:hypothetical protein
MHIFLGLPISEPLSKSNESIRKYFDIVKKILTILRKNGENTVFCALESEKWGDDIWEPDKAAKRDLLELTRSDIVVFFCPSHTISSLFIELGYATVLNKKCFLFQHELVNSLYLVTGFSSIGLLNLQTYRHTDELFLKISQLI